MTKRKNKNISHKVENGTTLQTRDEFIENGYPKENYENKGYYRKVIVIDSNSKNELAIIRADTKGKNEIKDENVKGAKYKAYVYTKDNTGKPIKVNNKFYRNKKRRSASKRTVNEIKKVLLIDKRTSIQLRKNNKDKLRDLKNRK